LTELSETIRSTRDYGDFVIRMQYVNPNPNEFGSDYEPALVIARPRRIQSRSAWILMLSSAWKYVDPDTDTQHSDYMVESSKKIAEMLNLQPSQSFQIAEAILDSLEDLINMPPVFQPTTVVAEGTMTIGGKKESVELVN